MKLKKQQLTSIVLGVIAVLLIAVYFIVTAGESSTSSGTDSFKLIEGEVEAGSGVFYMYEPAERAKIQSIKVENDYGEYLLYRDTSSGTFQLDGVYGLKFDDEMLSYLVVSVGYPTTNNRVAENIGEEGLAQFGLDDPQATFTLTKLTGEVISVNVGDRLVTENGYYAQVVGRDAVYIMTDSLEKTVLKSINAILSPMLVGGLTQTEYYYTTEFTIVHGDEIFVRVEAKSESEMTGSTGELYHKLVYPTPREGYQYTVNDNVFYQALYDLAVIEAEEVTYFIPTNEELVSVGLDEPAYTVAYAFDGQAYYIFVSEKQPDGYYYAISNMSGMSEVCKVRSAYFEFLEKDIFYWILTNPFFVNIGDVTNITIESSLSGGVDVDFKLNHATDGEGTAILTVDEVVSGQHYSSNNLSNFKQLYLSLLNITNQQFASLTEEDREALMSDDSKLIMTMTYSDKFGRDYEYKFYRYYEASTGFTSGGKIFVVVDGVGEFYTTNDLVEKVASDAVRLLAGLDVDGNLPR